MFCLTPAQERNLFYGKTERVLQKFADSGWDLIAVPSRAWLEETGDRDALAAAIRRADA